MTEPTAPEGAEAERTERIARLQARQAARSGGSPGAAGERRSDSAPRRRRSPAASAKVLVAGASSAAVFGLMAGFGIGDRIGATGASQPVFLEDPAVTPTVAAASAMTASTSPVAPEVIVIVVDEWGKVIATSADLDPAEVSGLPVSEASDVPVVSSIGVTESPIVVTPMPVEPAPVVSTPATAPTRIEVPVAIPAPGPAAAPAPPAAAVPAPPQATTGGS